MNVEVEISVNVVTIQRTRSLSSNVTRITGSRTVIAVRDASLFRVYADKTTFVRLIRK